jgi:hypothetical protein
MPIYAPDQELLAALTSYVLEAQGGVVKRAADTLGLDYIMVRRFLNGGRAKPENRQRIRNALDAAGWGFVNGRKIAHDMSLDVIRSMLTQLLEALDVYQQVGDVAGGVKQ